MCTMSRIYDEAQAKVWTPDVHLGNISVLVIKTRRMAKEYVLFGESQGTPKMQA